MAGYAEQSVRRRRVPTAKKMTVPGNLREACEYFNDRHFWETHESLEEIWQQEQGPVRDLYKGLIQVAAGFVHLSRGNAFGTTRLITTAVGYLAPYRDQGAMGFDVEAVCLAAERSLVGARQVAFDPARFDFSFAPHYQFDETALAGEARRWGAWGFDESGRAVEMEIRVLV